MKHKNENFITNNDFSKWKVNKKALEYKKHDKDMETLMLKKTWNVILLMQIFFGYIFKRYIIFKFFILEYKIVERNGFLFEVFDNFENTFLEFIEKFYFINNNPLPRLILIPEIELKDYLSPIINKVFIPKRGQKRELVQLVCNNAKDRLKLLLRKEEQEYNRTIKATEILQSY